MQRACDIRRRHYNHKRLDRWVEPKFIGVIPRLEVAFALPIPIDLLLVIMKIISFWQFCHDASFKNLNKKLSHVEGESLLPWYHLNSLARTSALGLRVNGRSRAVLLSSQDFFSCSHGDFTSVLVLWIVSAFPIHLCEPARITPPWALL